MSAGNSIENLSDPVVRHNWRAEGDGEETIGEECYYVQYERLYYSINQTYDVYAVEYRVKQVGGNTGGGSVAMAGLALAPVSFGIGITLTIADIVYSAATANIPLGHVVDEKRRKIASKTHADEQKVEGENGRRIMRGSEHKLDDCPCDEMER